MFVVVDDVEIVLWSFDVGVCGFILKVSEDMIVFVVVLDIVLCGGVFLLLFVLVSLVVGVFC